MSSVDPDAVARIPLFAGLDGTDRMVLAGWLDSETMSVGQRLTHQGASGYAFYVLISSHADVEVDGSVVRTLVPGDFFW